MTHAHLSVRTKWEFVTVGGLSERKVTHIHSPVAPVLQCKHVPLAWLAVALRVREVRERGSKAEREREGESESESKSKSERASARARARARERERELYVCLCVRVCVGACVRACAHYVCVCARVCVCGREGGRNSVIRVYVRECVCVCQKGGGVRVRAYMRPPAMGEKEPSAVIFIFPVVGGSAVLAAVCRWGSGAVLVVGGLSGVNRPSSVSPYRISSQRHVVTQGLQTLIKGR